jgi:endonuclease/exonuclease/phosphatase family metal-dependent hydrolase
MRIASWLLLGFAALSLGCVSGESLEAAEGSEARETGRLNPGLTYYTDARMVLVTANIRYGCWGESANNNGESCKVDGVNADGKKLMTALATQYSYIPDIVALQEIKMAGTTANLHDCDEHATNLRNAILSATNNALNVYYTPFRSDTFGGTCTLLRSGRFGVTASNASTCTNTGSGGALECGTGFPRTGSLFMSLTDQNNGGKVVQMANVHLPLLKNGANIKASVNKVLSKMTAGANLRIMMGDFNITKGGGTFDDRLADRGFTEINASGWTFNKDATAIDYIWLQGQTGFSGQEVITYAKAGGTYSDHRALRVVVSGY